MDRQWTMDGQWTCALCHLTMTSEDHNNKLLQLAIYLNGLLDSLPIKDPPDSCYDFQIFKLEAEWIDTIGSIEGAVNWELECQLGPTCLNLDTDIAVLQ